MQYGQIVLLLAIGFLIYYAVMIVMDLQKANAAKLAEAEKDSEEDIDISDEAKRFNPIRIMREAQKILEVQQEQQGNTLDEIIKAIEPMRAETAKSEEPAQTIEPAQSEAPKQQSTPHRPDYREPIMTDGITVDALVEEANTIAETGKSDLGAVIYYCEKAKSA